MYPTLAWPSPGAPSQSRRACVSLEPEGTSPVVDEAAPARPAAPASWALLPTELKRAVFGHLAPGGAFALAVASRDNFAIARRLPALPWAQKAFRTEWDACTTDEARALCLVKHRAAVRAGCPFLQLPIDSSQHLLDTVQAVLGGSGRCATLQLSSLQAAAAVDAIPTFVQARLSLHDTMPVDATLWARPLPKGLQEADISGLKRLADGTQPRLDFDFFPASVHTITADLHGLANDAFALPPHLLALSLGRNGLDSTQMHGWRWPASLARLAINDNRFGQGPFVLPPRLERLLMHSSCTPGAQLDLWQFPTSLRHLDVRNNQLQNAVLHLPPHLESLELELNQLTAARLHAWTWPTTLLHLDLSANPLGDAPVALPQSLRTLKLNATSLRSDTLRHWRLPDTLEHLELSHNVLLEPLPHLPSGLVHLSLDGVGLDAAFLGQCRLPDGLRTLSLNVNNLSKGMVPTLPAHLEGLSLRATGLRPAQLGRWLRCAPNLQTLDVSHNKLKNPNIAWPSHVHTLSLVETNVDIHHLKQVSWPLGLTQLYLDRNYLRNCHLDEVFEGLPPALEILSLVRCNLHASQLLAWSRMPLIKRLDVRYNHIEPTMLQRLRQKFPQCEICA